MKKIRQKLVSLFSKISTSAKNVKSDKIVPLYEDKLINEIMQTVAETSKAADAEIARLAAERKLLKKEYAERRKELRKKTEEYEKQMKAIQQKLQDSVSLAVTNKAINTASHTSLNETPIEVKEDYENR